MCQAPAWALALMLYLHPPQYCCTQTSQAICLEGTVVSRGKLDFKPQSVRKQEGDVCDCLILHRDSVSLGNKVCLRFCG